MIKAGVGAEVTLELGGKIDMPAMGLKGKPLKVTGKVKAITDGQFVVTGPMATGTTVRMGRTAVLDTGKMQIVVSEKRAEPYDLGVFTHCGIDPRRKKYVLIKSRQHFRAGFEPIAKHIVMCDGDGCTASDLKLFKYEQGQAAALSVRPRHAARPQRSRKEFTMATYDIVIRNGQVADGTGKKLFAADVALKGDRIAAVEAPGTLKGDNEIDATGKVVAPGFIDVHTHDDTALIDNPTMAMKASQGVTTVVCGNCGVSAAPYLRARRRPLDVADHQEEGKSLQELRRLRRQGRRGQARHQRRLPDRPRHACASTPWATISTACATARRDQADARAARPEPRAGRDRHVERPVLCRVQRTPRPTRWPRSPQPLGKWGGVYTAHMRDEGDHILKAMDETFEIGRRVGAEIIVSHHKCSGRSNFGRMKETLPKFTEAMKKQQIAFDVYPYVAGSTILRSDMLERADKVLITWSDKVPGMSGRDLKDIAERDGLLDEGSRPTASSRPAPSTS